MRLPYNIEDFTILQDQKLVFLNDEKNVLEIWGLKKGSTSFLNEHQLPVDFNWYALVSSTEELYVLGFNWDRRLTRILSITLEAFY
jgi:hypothetical protein